MRARRFGGSGLYRSVLDRFISMNVTLARRLTHAFPRLFGSHLFSGDDSVYPFECGDGWYQLIYDFPTQFMALERLNADLHINQVKEKFGGLWFYPRSGLSNASYACIKAAAARSFTICEECGTPGEFRNDRAWIRTLCPTHAAVHERNLDWPSNRLERGLTRAI